MKRLSKAARAAAMDRIADGGRLVPLKRAGATVSLSTPVVSSQDGPRMAGIANFGGKKAAPFGKGGKRRKAVIAKKMVAAAKRSKPSRGSDLSNVDLSRTRAAHAKAPARAKAPAKPIAYQIKPGDTLSALAARYGTTVQALAAANGIKDPNRIIAGAHLTVHPGAKHAALSAHHRGASGGKSSKSGGGKAGAAKSGKVNNWAIFDQQRKSGGGKPQSTAGKKTAAKAATKAASTRPGTAPRGMTMSMSNVDLSTLTTADRKALPPSAFVFPGKRAYPIHDKAHAVDALARSKGKPEAAAVRAAVRRRYPEIGKH